MIDVELRDAEGFFVRRLKVTEASILPGAIAPITKDQASTIRRIFIRQKAREPFYRETSALFIVEEKEQEQP